MKQLITLSLLATVLLLFNSCEQEEQVPEEPRSNSITPRAHIMMDRAKKEGGNIDSQCKLSVVYRYQPSALVSVNPNKFDLKDSQGSDSVAIKGEIFSLDDYKPDNDLYNWYIQDSAFVNYMLYEYDVDNRQKRRYMISNNDSIIKEVKTEYWENGNVKKVKEYNQGYGYQCNSGEISYDEQGNEIEEISKAETDSVCWHTKTVNSYENGLLMETITYTNNYITGCSKNTYFDGKLIETISERYGFSKYVVEINYDYDPVGRLVKTIESSELEWVPDIVTNYYYNSHGVLLYEIHDKTGEKNYHDEYLFYEYDCN